MNEKAEAKEVEVIPKKEIGLPQESLPARVDPLVLAIEQGASPETLEKLMALQERYEANEARKAYHVAMTKFKENPPEISKDGHVRYSVGNKVTEYKHATLANVTATINKALSEHGLSASWKTKQNDKGIEVACKITHILGHSESTSLEAGPDASGGKNSIQAIGSTVTYLERYTLLSLTGLATSEMDDDGQGSEAQYITSDQLEIINKIIEDKKVDLSMFLDYMGVETLDKIEGKDYKKATMALDRAHGGKK